MLCSQAHCTLNVPVPIAFAEPAPHCSFSADYGESGDEICQVELILHAHICKPASDQSGMHMCSHRISSWQRKALSCRANWLMTAGKGQLQGFSCALSGECGMQTHLLSSLVAQLLSLLIACASHADRLLRPNCSEPAHQRKHLQHSLQCTHLKKCPQQERLCLW